MNPYLYFLMGRPLSHRIFQYIDENIDGWTLKVDPFFRKIYPYLTVFLTIMISFVLYKCYYGNLCSSSFDIFYVILVILQSIFLIVLAWSMYDQEPAINGYRRQYEHLREHQNRNINMGDRYMGGPLRADHNRELHRLEHLLEINN